MYIVVASPLCILSTTASYHVPFAFRFIHTVWEHSMAISGNVSYSGLRLVFLVCGTQHDGAGSVRRRRPPRNDHFHLLGCEALHEAPNEGNLSRLRGCEDWHHFRNPGLRTLSGWPFLL
ncbi:hypothetical protein EDD16DRAFT_1572988, partial [Pisolithus croceorrhizus]